jgi:hypothetical protein
VNLDNTKFIISHAGTAHSCVFNINDLNDLNDVENFSPELSDNESVMYKYFSSIEQYRQKLEVEKTKETTESTNIDESIQFYNSILTSVATKAIDSGIVNAYNDTDFKKNYLLLQALGLKATSGKAFMSPIESCGVESMCRKFNPPDDNFVKLLKEYKNANNDGGGIKGCIHGHVPFCGTVPLIFKTSNENGIIEIACDTSNGNRPKKVKDAEEKILKDSDGKDIEVKLENVPLAIVYPDSAGITSVNTDGNFSNKNTLGLNNSGVEKIFQEMINRFSFDDDTFPYHAENTIQYSNGNQFSFVTEKSPFVPAKYGPNESNQKKVGGKKNNRKTKKNRKTKRKNNNKGKSKRSM